MPLNQILGLLVVGGLIGTLSGMLGIGGGVLVIPALTVLFGFTHQQAVGTSLGMLLPPIGIFAVLQYYRANQVNVPAAALLAVAFMGGAWLGAYFVTRGKIPDQTLRIVFAIFMIYVAGNMLFRSELRVWAVMQTLLLVAAFGLVHLLFRMIGKRWDREFAADEEYRRRVGGAMSPDYEI
jgi:uncharacterized membrane protein YfcA